MSFTLKIAMVATLCVTSLRCTKAQGTFVNLDFEQATIMPVPNSPNFPYEVYADVAIPGWTAYLGGSPEGTIYYDDQALGNARVSIHDTNSTTPILQGGYTVLLQPNFPSRSVTAGLGQTAQIPPGTRSLSFYGSAYYFLTFAGQPIQVATLGTGPNYTLFGADLTQYASQTGELRFTGEGLLDNIVFSSQAIPEPSLFALGAMGALVLAWKRRVT